MKVHNLMEDTVLEQVNEIFNEEEQRGERNVCTCYQCRLDVSCYVLNRIEPKYTVSGRGLAHHDTEYRRNFQNTIDLVALINEGINKVSRTKRPHMPHNDGRPAVRPEGPLHNFPIITGRLLDGTTFEPMAEGNVTLLNTDAVPVRMMDPNWPNPYSIVTNTAGHFNFWPFPVTAEKLNITRVFSFRLIATSAAYEDTQHFFELALVSQESFMDSCSLEYNHRLPDLYIFPKGLHRKKD